MPRASHRERRVFRGGPDERDGATLAVLQQCVLLRLRPSVELVLWTTGGVARYQCGRYRRAHSCARLALVRASRTRARVSHSCARHTACAFARASRVRARVCAFVARVCACVFVRASAHAPQRGWYPRCACVPHRPRAAAPPVARRRPPWPQTPRGTPGAWRRRRTMRTRFCHSPAVPRG